MAQRRFVYDSADGGADCPRCGRRRARCICNSDAAPPPPGDGIVRVRREVRRGKPATVVWGLPLNAGDLKRLSKELKSKCGAGGSAQDGEIVLQGDHCDWVMVELTSRGHVVKRAGG